MSKLPKRLEGLSVTDLSVEGKGIARHEERVVFIELAVVGDVVDVDVLRNKKTYLEARAVNWQTYSPDRVQAKCLHFGTCGGCKWQQLNYPQQLVFKQKFAQDALERIGRIQLPQPEPIVPSDRIYGYRNKLEFSASSRAWVTESEMQSDHFKWYPALGFHLPGRFDKILNIEHCDLQPEPSNLIRTTIRNLALELNICFYNARLKTGCLRTVMIRTAEDGSCMVLIQFFEWEEALIETFKKQLLKHRPEISSLWFVHNQKGNDTLEGLQPRCVFGKEFLYETLGKLCYKISPASFFQTNTLQAKKMYDLILEWSELQGHEIVYDLYTGTGTIALYLASKAKKVIGIEYVAAAIADAKENAQLNGIKNAHFFAGDMSLVYSETFIKEQGPADLVVLDPPRAGLHPRVIETLLQQSPPSIIYVSCNPATQARDLAALDASYKVDRVRPLDLFPHTAHVEQMVRLRRRS